MTPPPRKPSTTNDDVITAIDMMRDELKSEIAEIQRTLRGSNGTPGVVTNLGVLTEQVKSLNTQFEEWKEDHQALNDQFIACRYNSGQEMGQIRSDLRLLNQKTSSNKKNYAEEEDNEQENGFGSWKWFRDKNLFPVVMVIITYLVVEGFKVLIANLQVQ